MSKTFRWTGCILFSDSFHLAFLSLPTPVRLLCGWWWKTRRLAFGAGALYILRGLCVKILLGRTSPESEALVGQLAITMVFAGLLQSLALWSLASRWWKISLLYGGLGLAYWLTLLERLALLKTEKTPADLLQIMPVAAGLAFVILFCFWFITMKRHKHGEQG